MAFNLFPQTDFRQMDLNYVLDVSKQAAANLEEYAADKEQVVATQAAAEQALAAAQQDIETARQAATSASQDAQTATQAAGTATQAATGASQDARTASEAAQTAQRVQESIPADYTQLSNDVDALKSDLDQSGVYEKSWNDITNITLGTYTTNVAIGSAVSTEIVSSTTFGCQLVAVTEGDKFKAVGIGGNNPLLWAFTDSNYVLLSKATASADPQDVEITAPADGYLFYNSRIAGGATYSLSKYETQYAIPELQADVSEIESDLYVNSDINIIDKITMYRTYTTNGGVGTVVDFTSVATSLQFCSLIDNCTAGQQYKITGLGGNAPRLWCFVDTENKIMSVSGSYDDVTDLTITAPADGKLIFQFSISKPYAIEKLAVREIVYDKENRELQNAAYPFTGFDMFRNIAGLGDSYTEGDLVNSSNIWVTVPGISYLASIAGRNGITAYNYGSGGATTETYLSRAAFTNCLNDDPHDLYMLSFGINDASAGMTIGTVADINEDYTQNPNTFYGNYGRIITQLMAHAPQAKYILIMPWTTDADYTSYNTAVKTIADHYGIPCIDPSDDPFFKSHFWLGYKSGGHPTAMLYAGMGRAVERLFNTCVQNNPRYFRYAVIG